MPARSKADARCDAYAAGVRRSTAISWNLTPRAASSRMSRAISTASSDSPGADRNRTVLSLARAFIRPSSLNSDRWTRATASSFALDTTHGSHVRPIRDDAALAAVSRRGAMPVALLHPTHANGCTRAALARSASNPADSGASPTSTMPACSNGSAPVARRYRDSRSSRPAFSSRAWCAWITRASSRAFSASGTFVASSSSFAGLTPAAAMSRSVRSAAGAKPDICTARFK